MEYIPGGVFPRLDISSYGVFLNFFTWSIPSDGVPLQMGVLPDGVFFLKWSIPEMEYFPDGVFFKMEYSPDGVFFFMAYSLKWINSSDRVSPRYLSNIFSGGVFLQMEYLFRLGSSQMEFFFKKWSIPQMEYFPDEIFPSWIIAQMTFLWCVFCNTIPIVAKKKSEE